VAKLWKKNYVFDAFVEKFTVGEDYILDKNLLAADCVASIAHASMLAGINILTTKEFGSLKNELLHIIELFEKGEFSISQADEDCHTAIENHLSVKLGDVGKKIHAGRSRNDQIIAALRLYGRDFLINFQERTLSLIEALIDFAYRHEFVPMPGRTHMQIAMPSSVGLWAGSFAEELLDDLVLVQTAYALNDMCPLGSAASYGVPIPLNREMVQQLLGFQKLQNNVLYVNNSRGKTESIILDAVEQIALTMSKLAQDLLIYSMPEFRYFTIPAELCSGSSIMPQKKNPCGLELVRAKAASVSSASLAVKNIIRALPSGYNRDFQETKSHFIRGINTGLACVGIMELTVKKLVVNEEMLRKGFIPEIYATDRALELVKEGMPFRDAYKEVGLNLDTLNELDPLVAIKAKIHTGTTGNVGLEKAKKEAAQSAEDLKKKRAIIDKAYTALLGKRPELFQPL
jgi:argininosuccinate lyase